MSSTPSQAGNNLVISADNSSIESEANRAKCELRVKKALASNETIKKLISSIESLGCKIPEPSKFFNCMPCEGMVSGGLAFTDDRKKDTPPNVIVCDNKLLPPEMFEATLIHELVHAYDLCRVKSFSIANCETMACAEIRASNLSGECDLSHEILRGRFQFVNGYSDCVKRRAELSLSGHAKCKSTANECIGNVFRKCYSDASPLEIRARN